MYCYRKKRFFEKKSQNGRWHQLFSPEVCSVKPVLAEELKKSGCLCSKYLTSLLRHVYVNRLVWTSAWCDLEPRRLVSGTRGRRLRHFDITVRCAAHCAGATLSRENRPTVHEKPGRWSRKAGGRYSQCSFCMTLSVYKKAVVWSRWSLFALVAEARVYCCYRSTSKKHGLSADCSERHWHSHYPVHGGMQHSVFFLIFLHKVHFQEKMAQATMGSTASSR